MLFQVDPNAATAVYRQLVDQVCHGAASGAIKPRDPLPGIRPLARQLHLNRNTVAKAFAELERLGVIKTVPGKGCFIEPVNTPFTQKIRQQLLVARIDGALVAAHQLQIDPAEFSDLVRERIKFFAGKLPKTQPKKTETPAEDETATLTTLSSSPPKPKPASTSSPKSSLPAADSETWSPSMD